MSRRQAEEASVVIASKAARELCSTWRGYLAVLELKLAVCLTSTAEAKKVGQ